MQGPSVVPLVSVFGLAPLACLAVSFVPALGDFPNPFVLLQRPFLVLQPLVALLLLVV